MKRKAVIGILILCITLGITQFLLNATNPATAARKVKYDPIIIDGDIDFAKKAARKGWPGSGTSDDPYIIENYDLIIPYKKNRKFLPAAAISISNTTVFFEIRYSAISNFNGEVDGILLWNVINGRIYNNTISNFVNSIFLVGSDNIIIVNNNIYAYSENTPISPASQNIRFKINRVQAFISRGIFLDPSNHNVIANNNISGYTGTGVELLDSSDNLIDGNEIDNSAGENGVFLAGSDYNTITNNEIYDSGIASPTTPSSQSIRCKVDGIQAFISRGIFLDPSDHNVITNNNISGYTGTGVELLDSSDNLIDGNEIDNSAGENGVFLAGSDYNTIANNEIYDSGTTSPTKPSSQSIRSKVDGIQAFISRGIFLDPSNHNVIANNNISG
ncbi:MAG: nitrous oxide reductase family maturation protein NosD, partial [Promethearchaeota archaeon]